MYNESPGGEKKKERNNIWRNKSQKLPRFQLKKKIYKNRKLNKSQDKDKEIPHLESAKKSQHLEWQHKMLKDKETNDSSHTEQHNYAC